MKLKTLGIVALAALSTLSFTVKSASAATFSKGWSYGIDSFTDGSGGSGYEIKGIAIKQTGSSVYVALTGGTPLAGVNDSRSLGGTIGWGDLFFNFSGKDFKTASNEGSLMGIRFSPTSDSKLSAGVYTGAKATSVATVNSGYSSLESYYNSGFDRANTQGDDIATKAAAYNYFGKGSILNVIGSGTKAGNINMLTGSQLAGAGLDFGQFSANAPQTIGFSFDRSLLQKGNFLANIFLECGNDGVAIAGKNLAQSVPEASPVLGLGAVALCFGVTQLRKRSTKQVIA